MSITNKYSFNSGPKFNKPNCGKPYPYSSKTPQKAANLSGPQNLVDSLFLEISSISSEFDQLKSKINQLKNNWNQCITINGQAQDYIMKDDLTQNFNSLNEIFSSGKGEIDSVLSNYMATIEEINEYIDTLQKNYGEYQELKRERASYSIQLQSCQKEERSYYQNKIDAIDKQLENYQEIGNLEDFGEWVV